MPRETLEFEESLVPIVVKRPRAEEPRQTTEEETPHGHSAESGQPNH